MNIIIKNKEDIKKIREGGKILAKIMTKAGKILKPGISTFEIDEYVYKLIKENDAFPAFLNYRPRGMKTAFPSSVCVSINDEIVHGIPNKNKILKEGDIVSLDIGLKYKGLYTDHAMTFPVGRISEVNKKLLEATKKALEIGIKAIKPNNTIGDIGYAIETFVNKRYGIVRDLAGHGVGKEIHEDPYVPNYGRAGSGEKLVPGMIIAIEPMLCLGTHQIEVDNDDWTVRTRDGKNSAHFEHTVLITKNKPEILTK
jgi:methionyl aminopeptidase